MIVGTADPCFNFPLESIRSALHARKKLGDCQQSHKNFQPLVENLRSQTKLGK